MSQLPTARTSVSSLLDLDRIASDEERAMQGAVRKFVQDQVRPHVSEWFEGAGLPARELARELGTIGVLGMHLQGYGCVGASAMGYGLACLELEAGDSGLRSLVSVQGSLAMYAIHACGSEPQREQWLPQMATGEFVGCFGLTEADHGSDPSSMRTRAVRSGEDWMLNGTKMWITNGDIADVAIVWAQTADGIRGFLVPSGTPGFSANRIHGKLSLRASVTSELVFEDVRLPAEALLPGAQGLSAALSCLNEARFGIVFGALGAARDCLDIALEYTTTRHQFGRPIGSFQLIQEKLANLAVEYGKGVVLAVHLARLKDEGRIRPEQVSVGKLNSSREALRIARAARELLGANGISLDYSIMRHMANLESVLTYEGTAQMHVLTIGRALTGYAAWR
jgi:glutaryl-CoA dehydrogenase